MDEIKERLKEAEAKALYYRKIIVKYNGAKKLIGNGDTLYFCEECDLEFNGTGNIDDYKCDECQEVTCDSCQLTQCVGCTQHYCGNCIIECSDDDSEKEYMCETCYNECYSE